MWSSFFPSENLIHPFRLYLSILYPYFTQPLHTIIKRNIAYTQNYIKKCKKCFAILKKKTCLWQAKCLATLVIFITKWISRDNSNAVFERNRFIYTLLTLITDMLLTLIRLVALQYISSLITLITLEYIEGKS